jgi:hypothetical protein
MSYFSVGALVVWENLTNRNSRLKSRSVVFEYDRWGYPRWMVYFMEHLNKNG